MVKKTAIIVGISGQDGSYLCKLLLEKKYSVIGIVKKNTKKNLWRLEKLNILKNKNLIIKQNNQHTFNFAKKIFSKKIDEVYNFAAQSSVALSKELVFETINTNSKITLFWLESIRKFSKKTKYFQATTTDIINFKFTANQKITNLNIKNAYECSKIFSNLLTEFYKKNFKLNCCNGFLSAHESILRGENFVIKKIIKNLCQIKKKGQGILKLGNIDINRSWGSAEEYVFIIWKNLQKKKLENFVIGSKQNLTIRKILNFLLDELKLKHKWIGKNYSKKIINSNNKMIIMKIDKSLIRKNENHKFSYRKIKIKKYSSNKSFFLLLRQMLKYELKNNDV